MENQRVSSVSGHVILANGTLTIPANPNRVRLEIVASYYNTFRGAVYLDSVSGTLAAGRVTDSFDSACVFDAAETGDLCARRFVIKRKAGGSPETVGVIETVLVQSRVSGR